MNYNFKITPDFARQFKKLAKTNKHLPDDFDRFLNTFDHNQGKTIPATSGASKIRMSSTGKGKRGSYRVIYFLLHQNTIYFLQIYSKSIKENIFESEKRRLKQLVLEIKK